MPVSDGYLLAVDVGTTTTRCAIFDLGGHLVGEAYREVRVHYPRTNWTEVDAEDWWSCAVASIREAVGQAREVDGKEILGVGICGLKHAVVPVDEDGKPLARAMLWMDQRCRPQAEWMSRQYGDLVAHITGRAGAVSTTPSAPKLRWIMENDPGLLRRTHKFLLAKDFIRFKLTGSLGTDPSDAGGTGLYDRRSGDWAWQMLDLIGVPADKMPPISDPTVVAGVVTRQAARATGLAEGVPVVVGAGDVYATLVGANAFHPRAGITSARGCLYLGTAAWISVGLERPADRFFDAGCFGATATTGASLRWLLSFLNDARPGPPLLDYAALSEEAEGVPPGARGLVFLPHLMGERGPQPDPEAKGVLFGLTLAHTVGDIARALLEGCAFQLRRIAEELALSDLGEMVVVGGGAKSALWVRILCDVLGMPLLRPQVVEAGALGAAILAGVGVGAYSSISSASHQLVRIAERVEPDRAGQMRYEQVYALFLELERSVAGLYASVPAE